MLHEKFSPEGQRNHISCMKALALSTVQPTAVGLRYAIEQKFPGNATCWSQATDEIRDMAREARLLLRHDDPLDFGAIKTPAEWNTRGTDYIITKYLMMTPLEQREFYDRFKHWLR